MAREMDCIVCGSCVVDLLCRPVNLDRPIGRGVMHEADGLVLTGGGISLNAGVTMARLGMQVGLLSYVGNDAWSTVVRDLLKTEGIDDTTLMVHPTEPTSTTVVAIDHKGERSFFHCVGAPKKLDARTILAQLSLFARTRFLLLGYYSLMPQLESDLAEVFQRVREVGCRTAMDVAGDGGSMQPLDKILPHLDVFIPSLDEAMHQTGHEEPTKMIATYRNCGAPGLIGLKLGSKGVLLSPADNDLIKVDVVTPPSAVVDTTGAGDSFYGGLLTGLIKGMSVVDAAKLGAAAAACCVCAVGGSVGGRDFAFTAKLAGLVPR